MDFTLSEERQLLRDSIARFVANEYGFEARKKIVASPQGWSSEIWAGLAEMGLLGAAYPEAYGGFGGNAVDTLVVMQELGRGLVVEPYLSTVVLGGGAVALAGSDAQKRAILPEVVAGTRMLAFAHGEPQSRYELADVETLAVRTAGGYSINGRKSVVLHAESAHQLVVSARTGGGPRTAHGITLFLVDRDAPGLALNGYRTIDGLRAADVRLDHVSVPADAVIGTVDGALPIVERVTDLGAAALCAEAVGIMETLNALTLDYLRTRQQFGSPIGRFQALQHRAVDMLIHAEQSKSMAILAAVRSESPDPGERRRAVSAAKAHIGRSGRRVAQEAIQLHGGMGVTLELPAAHYAKRLTMIDFWLGDADHHRERFVTSS